MGLSADIKVYTEIDIFKVCSNLWVNTQHVLPISVVDVKKPDLLEDETALDHSNVLREI